MWLYVAGNSIFSPKHRHASCLLSVVVRLFLIVLISCLFLSSAGKVSSTQGLSKGTQNLEKKAASGKREVDKSPEVVCGTSSVVADDKVQTTCLVQVSAAKTVEFSDNRVVRVKQPSCFDD